MSIYGTISGLGGPGDDETLGPPWDYRGSHILPADTDPRGGEIGLALIPSHITRDGRDDQPEDGAPWPWLRLSLDGLPGDDPAIVINPAQARYLAGQLTVWADRAEGTPRPLTGRKTASTITDAELEALYARLEAAESDLAELTRARQHGAYTFCAQQVGHVTVAEFARKISEKRNAIGQRAEAVQYANEQLQRAEQAESAIVRVRALHKRNEHTGDCEHCSARDYPDYAVPWRCPTIAALDEPKES